MFGKGFDGVATAGSHRETLQTLGFGWLYLALAEILQPQHILVIGSGRGYSIACLALGLRHDNNYQIVFVDPGYSAWPVDEVIGDTAEGVWTDEAATKQYFSNKLGCDKVIHLKLTSD